MTSSVIAPANGSAPALERAEVAKLAASARAAQVAWAARSFAERGRVMRAARRLLADEAEDVISTIVAETGKTWEDAQTSEVVFGCLALGFWAGRAEGFLKDRPVRSSVATVGKRLYVRHQPAGVVGLITPWNYPLALPLGDAVPALMAGNAVIVKPSEATPLTALRLQRLFSDAGLPEGVFTVATGERATGEAVIDSVDMIAFTGSTATGRAVAERAGRNLIPVSLELGGKDAIIVLADADLDRAAETAVFYSMANAGQTCVSIERAYVEAAVHDEFVERVVERVRRLRQGPTAGGPGTIEVGAMTTQAQLELVEGQVAEALRAGARALTGGHRAPGPPGGRFFAPTVLVDVSHEMSCMRSETFGPVLPIMAVDDAEQAIAHVNDSAYGLAATVFTRDLERGEAIARRLEAGNVSVNDPVAFYAALHAPMGGWKESGVGRRHGEEGIRKYTHHQTVLVTRRYLRREAHTFPYSRRRTLAILRALKLRFAGPRALTRR